MMTGLDYDQIRGAINDALLVPDRKRELLQIFDDVLTECSKFRALHRQLGSCGTAGAGAAAPDSLTEAQTRAVEDLIGSAVVRLRLTLGGNGYVCVYRADLFRPEAKLIRHLEERAARAESLLAIAVTQRDDARSLLASQDERVERYAADKEKLRDERDAAIAERDKWRAENGPFCSGSCRRPEMVDRIAALEGDLGMERNRSELLRDDIEGVHKWLDKRGALRNGVGDRLSIVGRIMRLLKAKHQHSKQTKT